ncbi:hypothetical protein F4820DRAFT_419327, partial [Hypoxylon rubiginosum]
MRIRPCCIPTNTKAIRMTSSKGKPTDPKLREEIKEDIKQEPNKSGGGQGQWSAWKVSRHTAANVRTEY